MGSRCRRLQVERDGEAVPIVVRGVRERPFTFEGGGGLVLEGTLAVPEVELGAQLPSVVLVHGSGPSDRDETQAGNLLVSYPEPVRTFALLADALASRGFVVLRYDKRTCFAENSGGRCPRRFAERGYDLEAHVATDLIDDAAGAIRALAALPETRDDDVVVVGHSEGGNWVAPLLAREPAASAGVLLAASATPIDEVSVRQLRRAADFLEGRGEPALLEAASRLRAEADAQQQAYAAMRAGTFEGGGFRGASVAYWRSWFAANDAIERDWKESRAPMLALFGSSDFNIDPWHHAQYARWIEEGAHPASRAVLVPHATHAFVTVEIGTQRVDTAFSPAALEAILAFLDDPATCR